ncbi:MAG: hypothetical protein ACM336_11590 [Acidobacteriota bacterium]
MTKVQVHFELERPLDEELLLALAAAHGVYGMSRIVPSPDLRRLTVDYDATRLSPYDVEAVLRRCGIPIVTRA